MAKARDSMRVHRPGLRAAETYGFSKNDILIWMWETEVLDKTLRAQGYRPEPPEAASEAGKESDHERESES